MSGLPMTLRQTARPARKPLAPSRHAHSTALGKASRTKETSWFKNVTAMEGVACDIVGPHLAHADDGLRAVVDAAFTWARDA